MKEEIIVGIFAVCFFGIILGTVMGLNYTIESISCHKKYAEYEPEYTFWGGCRIIQNGVKTPVEMVRTMN